MSERVVRTIDFKTGEERTATTTTSADCLEDRIDGLLAASREQLAGPVLGSVLAIACDGCGALVEVSRAEPLPSGWSTDERGELCQGCQ